VIIILWVVDILDRLLSIVNNQIRLILFPDLRSIQMKVFAWSSRLVGGVVAIIVASCKGKLSIHYSSMLFCFNI
jgi:hypothetical protein